MCPTIPLSFALLAVELPILHHLHFSIAQCCTFLNHSLWPKLPPPLYSSFLCTWPTVLASTTLLSDLAAGGELASLQGVRISWQRGGGFCGDWGVASRTRYSGFIFWHSRRVWVSQHCHFEHGIPVLVSLFPPHDWLGL